MKRIFTLLIPALIAPFLTLAQGDNPNPVSIEIIGNNQTINCTSNPVEIGVKIQNWIPGFNFQWSNGSEDSVITVKPAQTKIYDVTITNPSIGFSVIRSIEVAVYNEPIAALSRVISIDKFNCPGNDLDLIINASGGHKPYSFIWSNGSTSPNATVNPNSDEVFTVSISDACGTMTSAKVDVIFETHDEVVAEDSYYDYYCSNKTIELSPDENAFSGGVGYGYHFSFNNWIDTDMPLTVDPMTTDKIPFIITDACGIQTTNGLIHLIKNEVELPSIEKELVCQGDEIEVTSKEDGFYFWNNGTMHVSYNETVTEEKSYELQYIDQCGDLHSIDKAIGLKEIDSEFDYLLSPAINQVSLMPLLNQEKTTVKWFVNGDLVSKDLNPKLDVVRGEVNEIELEVTDLEGCSSRSSRLIIMREGMDIPSAFSPNGDGLNDYFSIRFQEELSAFDIKIFDRWGQLMFHSRDQYFKWEGLNDGNRQTLASFAYLIKATTASNEQIEKRGTVSILTAD